MKRSYLRVVRRAYRYLRHPRIRKIKWLTPFTKAIFNKRYWKPCRLTVANGLSIGLFCAMLPIPLQMLLAALACLRARGNVPIALAACWVTNPITQIPIMLGQQRLGNWIHLSLGVPRPPFIGEIEPIIDPPQLEAFDFVLLTGDTFTLNVGDFIIGIISSGIILGLLAYPLIWSISLFIPIKASTKHTHNKGR